MRFLFCGAPWGRAGEGSGSTLLDGEPTGVALGTANTSIGVEVAEGSSVPDGNTRVGVVGHAGEPVDPDVDEFDATGVFGIGKAMGLDEPVEPVGDATGVLVGPVPGDDM